MEKTNSCSNYKNHRLNWFLPDGFNFIRELQLKSPLHYSTVINLSIGAPNRPTPSHICDAMKLALDNPIYHTYPPPFGAPELCEALTFWYKKRFNVNVDPHNEVLITVGIKEALFNAVHALVNPGDVVLIPDPGYPTYFEAVTFCGGKMIRYDSNQDEDKVLLEIARLAKEHRPRILFCNYPSNPTGRNVSAQFYHQLESLSLETGFILISDLAYSELAFDGKKVSSCFNNRKSLAGSIEFFAFSKTYNMAGWRIGAVIGDRDLLQTLKLYKSKIDSNVFYPIQLAAATALRFTHENFYIDQSAMYQERRDILFDGLISIGLNILKPEGAMYVWVGVPSGYDGWNFTKHLYDYCGVLGVPGIAYGPNGRSYIRLGLVREAKELEVAVGRIKNGIRYL